MINTLQNTILEKENEINELRDKLEQNLKILSNSSLNEDKIDRKKMMCVNFISVDNKVQFAIPCIGSDIFTAVEEKLYKQFPEYTKTNNSFLSNGQQILKFKSIAENKIGNGFPIILVVH